MSPERILTEPADLNWSHRRWRLSASTNAWVRSRISAASSNLCAAASDVMRSWRRVKRAEGESVNECVMNETIAAYSSGLAVPEQGHNATPNCAAEHTGASDGAA